MKLCKAMIFCASVLGLASCAPDLQTRLETTRDQAGTQLREIALQTSRFELFALVTPPTLDTRLTVFIEGDGYAWKSRTRPSEDPTPITPLVLSLAAAHTSGNTAYLARPCQFVGPASRNCDVSLWTNARYSEAVVSSLNEALTLLMARTHASEMRLVGYSGGGVLAALLAARRDDVTSIVTIAAPMDTDAFTAHHGVSTLSASLNPRDYADALASIPQVHIVGGDDEIVPESIVMSFMRALPTQACAQVRVIAGAEHARGWDKITPPPSEIIAQCEGSQ